MEKELVKINPEEVEVLKSQHIGKALVNALTAETPKEEIKWRKGRGGKEYPYCDGSYFIRKLNDTFGFLWGFTCSEGQIVDSGDGKKQIVVKGEVEVVFPGRTVETIYPDGRVEVVKFETIRVKKSQFGGSDVKTYSEPGKKGEMMDLADDFKAAGTDAMKKASTQFGIAMDVYGPREDSEGGSKISARDLEIFYWRAKNVGMTEEEADTWCKEQDESRGGTPKSLSNPELMSLIPKLIKMAKDGK